MATGPLQLAAHRWRGELEIRILEPQLTSLRKRRGGVQQGAQTRRVFLATSGAHPSETKLWPPAVQVNLLLVFIKSVAVPETASTGGDHSRQLKPEKNNVTTPNTVVLKKCCFLFAC